MYAAKSSTSGEVCVLKQPSNTANKNTCIREPVSDKDTNTLDLDRV